MLGEGEGEGISPVFCLTAARAVERHRQAGLNATFPSCIPNRLVDRGVLVKSLQGCDCAKPVGYGSTRVLVRVCFCARCSLSSQDQSIAAGIGSLLSSSSCCNSRYAELYRRNLRRKFILGRCGNGTMALERRTYPLLAVVLTATFVCVSVWRMSGGCPGPPYCVLEPLVAPNYQLLDPSNASSVPDPYDFSLLKPHDRTSLIDLHNFTFHMNDPVCNSSSPLFVVVVHSAPSHEANRRTIRGTWGQSAHVVFLVGEPNTTDAQIALERENDEHHDLIQGSFMDSYRNLTYKHVLGLKWVTYYCPGAKYVLKTDDDVFVNTPFLEEFLTRELSTLGARKLVLCEVLYSAIVKRSYRSKWRVSHLEYKERWYPDYCTGWAILYSPDAVFRLYREAQRSEYFWIDDVHITGTLLSRVNLTHTSMGSLGATEARVVDMMRKGQVDDFLFSLLPPSYYHELWNMVTSPSRTVSHQTLQTQSWTGNGVR